MKTFFFGLYLNLGAKFRTEIELLSLNKLPKNILLPLNMLNQQKTDAYAPALRWLPVSLSQSDYVTKGILEDRIGYLQPYCTIA